MVRAVPVEDAWEKWEARVPAEWFGRGCIHDWPWFFEGESTVTAKSVEEICKWLCGCEYVPDHSLFNELDFWQHPVTFEQRRCGDCEDFALWAWRKLAEMGVDAPLGVEVFDPALVEVGPGHAARELHAALVDVVTRADLT